MDHFQNSSTSQVYDLAVIHEMGGMGRLNPEISRCHLFREKLRFLRVILKVGSHGFHRYPLPQQVSFIRINGDGIKKMIPPDVIPVSVRVHDNEGSLGDLSCHGLNVSHAHAGVDQQGPVLAFNQIRMYVVEFGDNVHPGSQVSHFQRTFKSSHAIPSYS